MNNIIFKVFDLITICVLEPGCIIGKSLIKICIILIIAGAFTVWAMNKTTNMILDAGKEGTIPYYILMRH